MSSNKEPAKGSLLSSMFLVGGCCIGGGMLALPVGSGVSGYFPSLVMMALCWIAMTLSALLLVEVSLWMSEGAHVITMTSKILGPVGKAIAWVLFLYISYASLVAYSAGGGLQVAHFCQQHLGLAVSKDTGAMLVTLFAIGVVIFGGQVVNRVNSLFFVALIFAYVALVFLGTGEINTSYLFHRNWSTSWMAIPLLLTAFSFQTMVPSLTPILKRHTNALRLSIVGGTTIAFIVYIIWQTLILGIIPLQGDYGLLQSNLESLPATQYIGNHVSVKVFVYTAEFFGFFAIITSFFAMGLGLFDFLADGLKIKKEGKGLLVLALLLVVPTVIFATKFERAFIVALDTSGGYGDTILNGMIPVLMVWIGRYKMGYQNAFKVPGGKPLLVLVFAFFCVSFFLELFMQLGILPSSYEAYQMMEIHNPEQIIEDLGV